MKRGINIRLQKFRLLFCFWKVTFLFRILWNEMKYCHPQLVEKAVVEGYFLVVVVEGEVVEHSDPYWNSHRCPNFSHRHQLAPHDVPLLHHCLHTYNVQADKMYFLESFLSEYYWVIVTFLRWIAMVCVWHQKGLKGSLLMAFLYENIRWELKLKLHRLPTKCQPFWSKDQNEIVYLKS